MIQNNKSNSSAHLANSYLLETLSPYKIFTQRPNVHFKYFRFKSQLTPESIKKQNKYHYTELIDCITSYIPLPRYINMSA